MKRSEAYCAKPVKGMPLQFDRYLRFYDQGERQLDFGDSWGVYEYPDGQNQIWFDSASVFWGAKACINHPAIVDLIGQIPNAIGPISLFVTYLYGARSDKTTSGNRVVSNIAANMRSLLKAVTADRELRILMPHDSNDQAVDYSGSIDLSPYDAVVFPDTSARARLTWLASTGLKEIVCEKVRDQQTGDIVGFEVPSWLPNGRYLVADDICDGGATFVKVAQSMPHCNLDLAVVHGIFSGGALGRLFSAGYRQIWTTNSFVQHRIDDEADINRQCNVQNVW